jgi:hypothetical protein
MSCHYGEPVEFEVVSSDATTSLPLIMRSAGSNVARTLQPEERLVIQQVSAGMADTGGFLMIIRDTDGDGDLDPGDLMGVITGGINGEISFTPSAGDGMSGARGRIPRVLAVGAGEVRLAGVGFITRS